MPRHYLTRHSNPDELLRLKKSLQFIHEVIRSHEPGLYNHVGFSCAIAFSKAEELKDQISPFCPAYASLGRLIEALRRLSVDPSALAEAKCHLEAIGTYFGLEKYALVPRNKNT